MMRNNEGSDDGADDTGRIRRQKTAKKITIKNSESRLAQDSAKITSEKNH